MAYSDYFRYSPLASPLNVGVAPSGSPITVGLAAYCRKSGRDASHLWAYKDSFIGTEDYVKRRLEKEIQERITQESISAEKLKQRNFKFKNYVQARNKLKKSFH